MELRACLKTQPKIKQHQLYGYSLLMLTLAHKSKALWYTAVSSCLLLLVYQHQGDAHPSLHALLLKHQAGASERSDRHRNRCNCKEAVGWRRQQPSCFRRFEDLAGPLLKAYMCHHRMLDDRQQALMTLAMSGHG